MSLFHAYDIRGIVPDELSPAKAYAIGRAFVQVCGMDSLAVGRDVRLSADAIFSAFAHGVQKEQVLVHDCGVVTTPLFYYIVASQEFSAGAMITASHNPPEYNGFKMVRSGARPLTSAILEAIKEKVDTHPEWEIEFENFSGDEPPTTAVASVYEHYKDHIVSFIDPTGFRPFTIAVDAGNAPGGIVFDQIFSSTEHTITRLFFELDGTFPNHPANPLLPENQESIKETLKRGTYDFGIAFDGDADRCALFDEKGNAISGDILTAILSEHLLKRDPHSTILYDIRSSWVVPETITRAGGKPLPTRVGHVFIKQKMRDVDAVFAGELSGHYYFKYASFTEDTILPILLFMEILDERGCSASELVRRYNVYFQSGELNYTVSDKDQVLQQLEKRFDDAQKVSHLDGLSIEYKDWHANIRKSNTEPLLRLNVEALTESLRDSIVEQIEQIINPDTSK